MDFILLIAPMIVLWSVKMPWTDKLRLYLIFSVAAISCIGSVLRQQAQKSIDLDSTCMYLLLNPYQPPHPITELISQGHIPGFWHGQW